MIAGLDVIPGGKFARKGLTTIIDDIAKLVIRTTDEKALVKILKGSLKGSKDDVAKLATTLKNVDKLDDAKKLIDVSLKEGKFASKVPVAKIKPKPAELPTDIGKFADDIVSTKQPKGEFLKRIKTTLADEAAPDRDEIVRLLNGLDELGIKPSQFHDLVSTGGRKSLQGFADDVSRFTARQRKAETPTAVLKNIADNIPQSRKVSSLTRKAIAGLQTQTIDVIIKNLPPSMRGTLLRQIRNANTPQKLKKSLETIRKQIVSFNEAKVLQKSLASERNKIAFIRKIGEFNQTVIKDVKAQLGFDKPLRKLDEAQLDSFVNEMKNRLKFKREAGGLKIPKENATSASSEFYAGFVGTKPKIGERIGTATKNTIDNFKEGAEDTLGVVSTRLANIDPSLRTGMRRMEFNVRKVTLKDLDVQQKLTSKMKTSKMPKAEIAKMDVAMKNGFIDDVTDIAKKHGFEKELNDVRTMLDDMYTRAGDVGLEVEYRRNFFPRSFKTDKASVRAILNYFDVTDKKGVVGKAFQEAQMKLGRPLKDTEKVNVINTLMRGFKSQNVTLSKSGQLQSRVIDVVTPEINNLYENSFQSMSKYIEEVNNLIETRKFFGKHLDLKNLEANADMSDVVGAFVNNLISAGKILPDQEIELARILRGRFSGAQMSPWLGAIKNIGYMSVMSSPLNALTQIGDLAFAFYKNGLKSVPGLKDAIIGKGISRKDIGIDNIIAEFSDKTTLSNAVGRMFKINGLDTIDRLGKETFINGSFRGFQKQALKEPEKLRPLLDDLFGKEADDVLNDLIRGETTENVKFMLFNDLSDFQPITLSEVPLKYLEAPNGRVFYALKTYSIKLFDVYRRESFQLMKKKGTRIQGVRNMVKLSVLLAIFNGTADTLKDFVSGKTTEISDRVVESFAKAIGFGRYTFNQVGKEGLGRTAAEQILPPTQLFDDLSRDMMDVFMDTDDDFEVSKLRTIRNIPIVGKLFYWWFGRVSERKETGGGSSGIPVIKL